MSLLGFIGVGDLAVYTIKGLRQGGYSGRILLSPRNRQKAESLAHNHGCEIAADNQSVADACDYLVLATRPPDCIDALSALELRPGQLLISVVAGVEIERLKAVLSADVDIVRAMPVSSAEVGYSPTLVYPRNDFVCELFDYCGRSLAVDDESHFDQGTILACVYSWYFALFETLTEATGGARLPREIAVELVCGMARGAADLALAYKQVPPGAIADSIATDGTYSRLGLDRLNEANAFEPWREACELLRRQLAGS